MKVGETFNYVPDDGSTATLSGLRLAIRRAVADRGGVLPLTMSIRGVDVSDLAADMIDRQVWFDQSGGRIEASIDAMSAALRSGKMRIMGADIEIAVPTARSTEEIQAEYWASIGGRPSPTVASVAPLAPSKPASDALNRAMRTRRVDIGLRLPW